MDLSTFLGTSLAATAAAFALTAIRDGLAKKRRAVAQVRAAMLDVDMIGQCVTAYLQDQGTIFAPAYRLPSTFLHECLLAQAGGDFLTIDELRRLHEIHDDAQEVNRSLDRLHHIEENANDADGHMRRRQEVDTLNWKCEIILNRLPGVRSAATAAIDRALWNVVAD